MPAEALLIDGYVDEPACLGVPPFISPYIRTVAGVLHDHGFLPRYLTIDQIRTDPQLLRGKNEVAIAVMIAGITVPGKYLGGTPATLTEIQQIGTRLRGIVSLLAGPIGFGYASEGGEKAIRKAVPGFDHLLTGSPPEALDNYLSDGRTQGLLDYTRSDPWSISGADIIKQHPSYPFIMCELETARGCPRSLSGGCSFCTESFYGPPRYRSVSGISGEVAALVRSGARHFRLGRQPDLLVYHAPGGAYPVPQPERIGELFAEIRAAAPGLQTLHIDNINPGTIARHEDAARSALAEIVCYHTPGDVAAFGMETADTAVVAANNLKAGPEEVMRAITIVNEVGAVRQNGIPELLPGLNFVCGLAGETPETYTLNEQFLSRLLASNLLVRRVNIRQLMAFEGTRAYHENTLGLHSARFRAFKEKVRNEFDLPMLRKVFPLGTVISGVVIEQKGPVSFGRQMGSYPILVGIPLILPVRTEVDVIVVEHGMRSVSALPSPIRINELPLTAIKWIPGIGRNLAGKILAQRPLKNKEALRSLAGIIPLEGHISFVTSP